MEAMIFFTAYAHKKFSVLERHDVVVRREDVMEAVLYPDAQSDEKRPLIFVRKKLHDERIICVAYKAEGEMQKIITFYPL